MFVLLKEMFRNLQVQIFCDSICANFHHLIFNFIEVGNSERSADVPSTKILVNWSDKLHSEVAVGKCKNFIEAICQTSFDNQTHQAETNFRILGIVKAVS